jgi:two-component system response regulator (stage 0 sporulation protein A)
MANHINLKELDRKMTRMGFRENISGTPLLREAVQMWRPGMGITKELYPALAKRFASTPTRVERSMRHAITTAWERGEALTIMDCFGYSVSPYKSAPTVGEFVARMARVCALED